MKNASTLIQLRNTALLWGGVTLVTFGCTWWLYGFFGSTSSPIIQTIAELETSLTAVQQEGTATKKSWEEMDDAGWANARWDTMKSLVPGLQKLVGTGTTNAAKNIAIMKEISKKTGKEAYITWLEKSWTSDAEKALMTAQADIAEIIPVFTGISELVNTKDIAGKITLKSLTDYIQTNIVDAHSLSNVFGGIGIDRVKFLTEAPEVGIYEIPLRFEGVSNENIIHMFEFLGKTGGIELKKTSKTIAITHKDPKPITTSDGQSSLKNLLITVKDATITPAKIEKQEEKNTNISTRKGGLWDVHITLQFYIRGVSRDYIAMLDTTLSSLLSKTDKNSLIVRGNSLANQCSGCPQASQIRDIVSLLGQAKIAYDSILTEEKNPKKNFTPIEILNHRVDLMNTVDTLKKKLESINIIPSTN